MEQSCGFVVTSDKVDWHSKVVFFNNLPPNLCALQAVDKLLCHQQPSFEKQFPAVFFATDKNNDNTWEGFSTLARADYPALECRSVSYFAVGVLREWVKGLIEKRSRCVFSNEPLSSRTTCSLLL